MPRTPHFRLPDTHQPSTPYRTHYSRNHHHRHIRSDQNNSNRLEQVKTVDKELKISYDILGMDKIRPQN